MTKTKIKVFQEFLYKHLVAYPTPINFSYFFNFGALAGLLLGIQILSGIFLAMYYVNHINFAFDSVEYIMREVPGGWFIRYVHSNGASIFFMVVYIHMGRGFYYSSFFFENRAP